MADNRERYIVEIGGVKHTLLLTAATAKTYGTKAVKVPANKSRKPANKAG